MDGKDIETRLDKIIELLEIQANADIISFTDVLSLMFLFPAFVTGWFGMNFEHLPFLKGKYAHRIAAGMMLIWIICVMLYLMTRKGGLNSLRYGNVSNKNLTITIYIVLVVALCGSVVYTASGILKK